MSKKNKKRARRVVKRTARAVRKLSQSVGPVMAGLAAGLAARDVTGGNNSYLADVSKDFARLLRTISSRASARLQTSEQPSNGASTNEHSS
jgi:hypothetical protein